jgi:hypothetical protein
MTNTHISDDIQGLQMLREKLVARRRSIVGKLVDASGESISGETFSKIQGAIDAIDNAIADEHELVLRGGARMAKGIESFRMPVGTA